MKKICSFFCLWVLSLAAFCQAPSLFNYQGVARDLSGNPIVNQTIGLRMSIVKGAPTGIVVFQETHTPTSSSEGLFSVQVGGGLVGIGNLSGVLWGEDTYYLQIEIDPANQSNYSLLGTSQLLSVPYALHAENGTPWEKANGGLGYFDGHVGVGPDTSLLSNPQATVTIARTGQGLDNLRLQSNSPAGAAFQIDSEAGGGHFYKLVATAPGNTNQMAGSFGIKDETVAPVVGNAKAWRMTIDPDGDIGMGVTMPASKLHISGGDIYLEDVNTGVIMTSPNGGCWRMTVDNTGQPVFTTITCPN